MNIPRTLGREPARADERLQLMVVEGDAVAVHDLPARGSLLVGRGADVAIQLTDPIASARHARLHVDEGSVSIEDLASRNGTQVRGSRLEPNQLAPLALGEAAMLGGAVLILQAADRTPKRRRVWPHGYFEMRLAEECDASETASSTFSVARLDVDRRLPEEAFVEAAAKTIRPSDVVGVYGPGSFEILFRRTTPEAAEASLQSLLASLGPEAGKPRFAFAHYPADGLTAHSLVEKACAGVRPKSRSASRPGVIVLDEKMKDIYKLAEKAAAGMINILILGETGVGKEVLAQTIHRASKRADGPFLCLNCGAFTENLLESELFGHERGAFTDAKAAKPGLLESAAGGTVFLDEIGEMSTPMQIKLLRALETKQVLRVGGLRPISIDVRFLAATHRDLVQEIREKRFRSDLYYRLNSLVLEIPPLRSRPSEIEPLCEEFLTLLASQSGIGRVPRLGAAAASLLESYAWPGNIRELRNVMERALLLCDGGDIEPDHLPVEMLQASAEQPIVVVDLGRETPEETLSVEDKAERARVLEALAAENGNQTRAARRLGIARGTLVARIKAFGIGRPQKR